MEDACGLNVGGVTQWFPVLVLEWRLGDEAEARC